MDEYQDTNRLQAEIVRGLAVTHDNVMAVGDDSQSIYSFRGANFRNIMDFETLFPGTRLIKLEENYRSTPPILGLANAIIDRAPRSTPRCCAPRRGRASARCWCAARTTARSRASSAQRILELREEGVALDEIAVLFRSSFHSFDLELELQRHDIPFVKRGGFKFIETAHVKDVLAHLRVVANPRDAVSWHRVLLLLDGLGPEDGRRRAAPRRRGRGRRRGGRSPGGRSRGAARTRKELGRLRRAPAPRSAVEERSPGEQVTEVVGFYAPMLRHLHPDDFPKREKDLEHFLTIAARYRSLASLLTDMALEPPTDSVGDVLAASEEDEGLLTLSTIHSAKGLEWRAVFVIGLVDGRFPSYQNLRNAEEVEEERRLLYVAVTRAKEHLYLSYPIDIFDRATGMVLGKPSRFVEGFPSSVLGGMQVVEEFDDPA